MQVINNPVQKIAAAAVTRQSVSIDPPNFIAVLWQLWVGLHQAVNRLSIRKLPDPPRMREAKPAGILQPIAERAVEADMGQPDHRDRENGEKFAKLAEIPDSFGLAIEMETAARRCLWMAGTLDQSGNPR